MILNRTTKSLIDELNIKNTNITVIGEYKGKIDSKISVRCNKCGYEWNAKVAHLLDGHWCPKCSMIEAGKRRIEKHKDEFIHKAHTINPDIVIKGEYKKATEKLLVECKKCGCNWYITPNNLLRGRGCPRCSGKYRRNTSEFVEQIKIINPNIEILSEYKSTHQKVKCKCKIDSAIWYAPPHDLLIGAGCPICGSSKGENRISSYLTNNNITYISQKNFDNLKGTRGGSLSYDFYIPDKNLLIEYQGQFHDGSILGIYQTEEELNRQKEHDRRKRDYAERNGIRLLEIWYHDFNNIEEILEKEVA